MIKLLNVVDGSRTNCIDMTWEFTIKCGFNYKDLNPANVLKSILKC